MTPRRLHFLLDLRLFFLLIDIIMLINYTNRRAVQGAEKGAHSGIQSLGNKFLVGGLAMPPRGILPDNTKGSFTKWVHPDRP